MLQLSGGSGGHVPGPVPRYGSYLQPPPGAGHLSVEYDPRPTAAREARAEVRRRLEEWGLTGRDDPWDELRDEAADRDGPPARDDLSSPGVLGPEDDLAAGNDLVDVAELLVSELVTNAVLHAASPFRLTLSASHGVLRCEVTDTGRGTPQVLCAGTGESGRGMFLVDALARRWGCHQDGPGKTVWFELGTCGSHGCGRRQP
ncbi:ATP-binding protein [Streptomyces sp. AK08-02]|uniref:ATP-binding protein n=1 Tax=Streptomyces sp. AK08-02 TaxID=3028654 RepID=UPI0029BD8B45|nr:ATP-binding protein [Streptomyces sp. AK08-02]MDX3751154.1 ATP-binding protein [Streptomyces sp. AK08-02]